MKFKTWHFRTSLIVLLISFLTIGIPRSWAQDSGDEDIESLDIIEVLGTAVTRESQKLSFPSPDLTNFRTVPTKGLVHLPAKIQIDRPVSSPTVLLDPLGKARGIRSSVKPMKAKRPHYPRFAREQAWHGTTILRITVKPDGNVSSITTQKSSGFPILDESAYQAIEQWVFTPAKNGEFAVASTVDVPIRFELDQPN